MSANAVKTKFLEILALTGRAALNASFPDDIEYYSLTLELVDSKGITAQLLIFPVMPSNISETFVSITNVKKTSAGVSVLTNDTFVPFDINLVGDFGTKFRFMLGQDAIFGSGISINSNGQFYNNTVASIFSSQVKSGYGVYKLLEKMCLTSQRLDKYN